MSQNNDLISRRDALDEFCSTCDRWDCDIKTCAKARWLRELPSAQPDHVADISKKVEGDCISKQVAVELAMKYCPDDDGAVQCEGDIRGLLDELENLPSAQPELIRCKDCKYWIAHDKRCVYLNHGFAPNMWCCHGERRTDG